MKVNVLIVLLLLAAMGYSQSPAGPTSAEMSKQLVEAYRSGDLDSAEKIGIAALALAIETKGKGSSEAAASYSNLGIVYKDKESYSKASENFEQAILIYENLGQKIELAAIYQLLGVVEFRDRHEKRSESAYLKALELLDEQFGSDNKESLDAALSLANLYGFQKKYEESDKLYIRAYRAVKKNFTETDKWMEKIQDSRTCSQVYMPMSSREKNEKRFNSDFESIFGKPKNAEDVVNGKALSLPAPYYPAEFRARRIAGVVVIGIEIDTDGNVAKTRVICGHPALGKTSEAAARKAK
ncbi:MAG: tetratricopeptide repeat protein, partial [Acidobacteria bacterium]|nr:tetratricopeptide repeat protein [Acidobacteriota bacterium]